MNELFRKLKHTPEAFAYSLLDAEAFYNAVVEQHVNPCVKKVRMFF